MAGLGPEISVSGSIGAHSADTHETGTVSDSQLNSHTATSAQSSFDYAKIVETNPFVLPSDDEFFRFKEEEHARKEAEKIRQKNLKIWEKGRGGPTDPDSISRNVRLQQLLKGSSKENEAEKYKMPPIAGATGAPSGSGTTGGNNNQNGNSIAQGGLHPGVRKRAQEKENMTEFIAKKREMFFVQMALDTKREEIRKLEEKARMKEDALTKSEQMLQDDAIRFDSFLTENNKQAHEAIKKAEQETKQKQDKVQEIKKLNQQIQMVQTDMSKHKEILADCLKYKSFLDELTPNEYFEEQKQIKRNRQEDRRNLRIKKTSEDYEAARSSAIEQWEAEIKAQEELETAGGKKKKKRKGKNAQEEQKKVCPPSRLPKEPNYEEILLTSSGEDLPMYFTSPSQLLDIFQSLEEQNLALIQNSQETEQQLEELKNTYKETEERMNNKTAALKKSIEDLQRQIRIEENKAKTLDAQVETSSIDSQQDQARLLKALDEKVAYVYGQCGFSTDAVPTTRLMLGELEQKLEDLLSALDSMPEEYVIKAERDKMNKRREKKRLEQQQLQLKQQEERNRKALERSMQAPKKRTGRQVMYRSKPIRKSEKIVEEVIDQDALDEIKYLS